MSDTVIIELTRDEVACLRAELDYLIRSGNDDVAVLQLQGLAPGAQDTIERIVSTLADIRDKLTGA